MGLPEVGRLIDPAAREPRRDKEAPNSRAGTGFLKKVYISRRVLLDKTLRDRYNISRVRRQQVAKAVNPAEDTANTDVLRCFRLDTKMAFFLAFCNRNASRAPLPKAFRMDGRQTFLSDRRKTAGNTLCIAEDFKVVWQKRARSAAGKGFDGKPNKIPGGEIKNA